MNLFSQLLLKLAPVFVWLDLDIPNKLLSGHIRLNRDEQGITALPCFVAKTSGLVPILPEQTLKQDVWLMRHLDTKDSDYSTLISETIEKELQEYLL